MDEHLKEAIMHKDSQNYDVLGGIGNEDDTPNPIKGGDEMEKERLQLERVLLSERIMRLQAEFEIAKRDIGEVEKKLAELMKVEKEEGSQA